MTIKDELNNIIADKKKKLEKSVDVQIEEDEKNANKLIQAFEILNSQLNELFDSIEKKYAKINIFHWDANIEIGYFNEEKGYRETDIYLKIYKSHEYYDVQRDGDCIDKVRILPGFDIEEGIEEDNFVHFEDEQSVIKYLLERLGEKIAAYQLKFENNKK